MLTLLNSKKIKNKYASINRNRILKNIIFSDCKDRFYGYDIDCAGKCGHCKNNGVCTKDTGYCVNGCDFNFQEPRCQGNPI